MCYIMSLTLYLKVHLTIFYGLCSTVWTIFVFITNRAGLAGIKQKNSPDFLIKTGRNKLYSQVRIKMLETKQQLQVSLPSGAGAKCGILHHSVCSVAGFISVYIEIKKMNLQHCKKRNNWKMNNWLGSTITEPFQVLLLSGVCHLRFPLLFLRLNQ